MTIAAGIAAVAATPVATSAAPLPLSDPMCPRAVPKLAAFNDAGHSDDLGRIAQAAHAVAKIYEACAADAQSRTGQFMSAEPFLNYEKTRAAQFFVVEGRALIANGNLPAGIDALKEARHLAEYVANWQPESLAWDATNRAGFTNEATVVSRAPAVVTDDAGRSAFNASVAQHNSDRQGSRYQTAALEIDEVAADVLRRIQALHLTPKPAQML